MRYEIFDASGLVNTVISDPEFVDHYCQEHGYTFKCIPEPAPEPPALPSMEDRIVALEAENAMLEECIIEIAQMIYA